LCFDGFHVFFVGFVFSIFWRASFCDCGFVPPRESTNKKRVVVEKWRRKQRKTNKKQRKTQNNNAPTTKSKVEAKGRSRRSGGRHVAKEAQEGGSVDRSPENGP